MHFTIRHIPSLLLLLACTARLAAQEPDVQPEASPRIGLYGAAAWNMHRADFRALPGVPSCCPQFESGQGVGASIGALFQLPLAPRWDITFRLGYNDLSARLIAQEPTVVSVDNTPVPGRFEHTIDASVAEIALAPIAGFQVAGGLRLHAGAHAGLILQHDYEQKEEIVEPVARGTFLGGGRTQNESSGTIPNASSFNAGLIAGVSYTLPLNSSGSLMLAPELFGSFALTPIVSGISWHTHALRLGLSLSTSLGHSTRDEQPPASPVTPPARTASLSATIVAYRVNPDGSERPLSSITVEQFRTTTMRPLANMIFFNEGEHTLPPRYDRLSEEEARTFETGRLQGLTTLATYHQILNIIGRRMQERPDATLQLTGCNADYAAERGDTALSLRRAEQVREYLVDVWGIAPERLPVAARSLPAHPSNPETPEGREENRRVELAASDPALLAPIVATDTVYNVRPEHVRVRPEVRSEAGVADWQLGVTQGGQALYRTVGTGAPESAIDWHPADLDRNAVASGTLDFSLDVTDRNGQTVRTTNTLPLSVRTLQQKQTERVTDQRVDKYSLILFDFGDATLNAENRATAEFIKANLPPDARVSVTGYTDRVGDAETNRRIARERARATAEAIGVPEATTRGSGERTLLYDNSLPEGRVYCRTVEVTVAR